MIDSPEASAAVPWEEGALMAAQRVVVVVHWVGTTVVTPKVARKVGTMVPTRALQGAGDCVEVLMARSDKAQKPLR